MTNDASQLASKCRDAMWQNDRASQDMGMEVEVFEPGNALARFTVRPDMLNGYSICHGGYLFALADSAFAFACNSYDQVTVAASASIEFLQPGKEGDLLEARAVERRRGGRTGIYDVTISNQNGAEVAIFRGRSYATKESILKK